MPKFLSILRAEKKISLLAILTGILAVIMYNFVPAVQAYAVQKEIAQEVVRFHVLANSDSEQDQNLKLLVRDGVLELFREELSACATKEETKAFISENLENIKTAAETIIVENGYSYSVTAELAVSLFPRKTYSGATFPGGEYEALKIVIGDGAGQNWWCMMFPPLCYADFTKNTLPQESKEQLKKILKDSEYEAIMSGETKNVTVKFKIFEIFKSLF